MRKLLDFLKKHKVVLFSLTMLGVLIFTISKIGNSNRDVSVYNEYPKMSYADFEQAYTTGGIDLILYAKSSSFILVHTVEDDLDLVDVVTKSTTGVWNTVKVTASDDHLFNVVYPNYDSFRQDLAQYNIPFMEFSTVSSSDLDILGAVINIAIMGTLFMLMIPLVKQMLGADTMEGSRETATSDVKFSNIIGLDEILDDVKFIVDALKNPSKFEAMGVRVPKGILLTGEPGTGKTLIAKAIAGEAGVPFYSINGSDFVEKYVGVGAKRVRTLFQTARQNSPCVIFIDELDAVGSSRGNDGTIAEHTQTIDALLKELDGFTSRDGVFVIAATNYPDRLDKALIRPGRFDRRVNVNPPRDWKVRKEMMEMYLSNSKLSSDVDLDSIAKTISGFTGADISALCNEAGIIALMHDKAYIDTDSLEEAIDKRVFNGNRSKSQSLDKDKHIVAYHEAGHAVVSYILKHPIARVSIIPSTSGVGGAVFKEDKTDTVFLTKQELEEDVMTAYGGRASEYIKFSTITSGAENDITKATQYIEAYVCRLGFDEQIGLIDMNELMSKKLVDTHTVADRISELAAQCYAKTVTLLKENYNLVEILATKLIEVETLTGDEVKELFEYERHQCD